MNSKMRMLCLAAFLIGLGVKAEDTGDATDDGVLGALKEVQAAKAAKNKAVKTAGQLLDSLPPVVANYGDKAITASEIRDRVKPKLQVRLHTTEGKLTEADVKKEILEQINQIIDDEVLQLLAEKAGLKPDLDAARRKIGADIEKNPVAETLFAAQGLNTAQAVRNQAMQQLREDWIKEVIVPKVAPAEAEILKVYEERYAQGEKPESRGISHILIKAEPEAAPEIKATARKKCEDLLAKVKAGANFADLARKNSDCPSKSKGGSLGDCSNDGSLVKEFTAVAFKLKEGEISDIVETQFGYHIIKIDKITPAGRPPLERVKKEIIENMSKEKSEKLAKQTLEEARQTIPVKINL